METGPDDHTPASPGMAIQPKPRALQPSTQPVTKQPFIISPWSLRGRAVSCSLKMWSQHASQAVITQNMSPQQTLGAEGKNLI